LKVFANWARQQVEESKPEAHRLMIDDVIYTFSVYAQRLEGEPSRDMSRAATLRLRVLVDLLETPSVNAALRNVNWAWLREWEQGTLNQREARLRCTVIFPTICAAERVQRSEASRSWRFSSRASAVDADCGPRSLRYLAAWCTDFLGRADVRSFLGLAESEEAVATGVRRPPQVNFLSAGALYDSESDTEEEEASPQRSGATDAAAPGDKAGGESAKFQKFGRRKYEGQEHCWDSPDSSTAMVRGASYLQDRVKVNSKGAMLELVEADLIKTNDEMVHYSLSPRGCVPARRAAGDSRFYFVLNFRLLPIQLGVVWAVPKDADWLSEPEGVLFQRFIDMSTEQRRHRLKVLPKITEGPWLVKQGVPDRPGVVGKKLSCEYFVRPDHLEFSVNCISSPAGRRIAQLLTGAARHFSMELSIIIEGQAQDELPERVLGGLAFTKGDLSKIAFR